MDDLKIICGEKLVEGLTIDNAADILVLADVHNAEDLKQNVIEFTKKYN